MSDITRRIADVLRDHMGEYADDEEGKSWAAHVAEVLKRELQPDIDEVAEAIWQQDDEGNAQRPGMWVDLDIGWKNCYRCMARAAVAAMGWVRADTEEPK